jgi:hypothetical protein
VVVGKTEKFPENFLNHKYKMPFHYLKRHFILLDSPKFFCFNYSLQFRSCTLNHLSGISLLLAFT